jgi:hypothetical protein
VQKDRSEFEVSFASINPAGSSIRAICLAAFFTVVMTSCSQSKQTDPTIMLSSFEKICLGSTTVGQLVKSVRSDGWKDYNYQNNSYFASFKKNLDAKGTMFEIRGFEKESLSLLLYRHRTSGNVTVIGCDMIDMSGATEIDDPTLEAAFGPLDDSKRTPALDSSGLVMRIWPKWVKDPSKRIIYMRDEKRGQNDLTSDPHQMAGKAMLRSSWDEQK